MREQYVPTKSLFCVPSMIYGYIDAIKGAALPYPSSPVLSVWRSISAKSRSGPLSVTSDVFDVAKAYLHFTLTLTLP